MVTSSYWPGYEGGAERQCRKLVADLVRRGHTCTVITARTAWGQDAVHGATGARVLRVGWLMPLEGTVRRWWCAVERLCWHCPGVPARHLKPLTSAIGFWLICPLVFLARWSFIAGLRRAVARGKVAADIVHVHEAAWIAGLGVWMAQRLSVPVLCKEASNPVLEPIGFDTPIRRTLDRLRRRARFVAQTGAAAIALQAKGVPVDRIQVIPNGVDVPDVPLDGDRQASEVLYVGNFSQGAHWKAFDVLLEAWADVVSREPAARLTMVGGGDPTAWQTLARELGCAGRVRFEGATAAPETYYARAALLVLPSRVEGMSNVLLEALSWGLPVVVSDIPGNTAIVTDHLTGLVVPVNDAGALADGVVRLLGDAGMRARLGGAARAMVKKRLAMSHVAAQYEQLYTQLRGDTGCEC